MHGAFCALHWVSHSSACSFPAGDTSHFNWNINTWIKCIHQFCSRRSARRTALYKQTALFDNLRLATFLIVGRIGRIFWPPFSIFLLFSCLDKFFLLWGTFWLSWQWVGAIICFYKVLPYNVTRVASRQKWILESVNH